MAADDPDTDPTCRIRPADERSRSGREQRIAECPQEKGDEQH
jgi:hypothetical protein